MTFTFFSCFKQDLGRKVHNLNSDTIKVVLSNTAPTASTNAVLSDITQIANGNGYTTDGAAVTAQGYSQTGGTGKFSGTSPTWTASGAVGPFRYVVFYNSTSSGKELIGYADRGSSLSLVSGDTYTPSIDGTNGLFQLS